MWLIYRIDSDKVTDKKARDYETSTGQFLPISMIREEKLHFNIYTYDDMIKRCEELMEKDFGNNWRKCRLQYLDHTYISVEL